MIRAMEQKTLLLFLGGIVVGVLLVLGWFMLTEPQSGSYLLTSDNATSTDTAKKSAWFPFLSTKTTGEEDEILSIPSPQDPGFEVAVTHISVDIPTWVVIYEARGREPGNALGAALFTSERKSGAVILLRGTLPGQTYLAGQSRDDGDHIFSLDNDPPVRNTEGDPMFVEFRTR